MRYKVSHMKRNDNWMLKMQQAPGVWIYVGSYKTKAEAEADAKRLGFENPTEEL